MTNEQVIKDFEFKFDKLLDQLSPAQLRSGVRVSFPHIGEKARQIALAA